MDGQPVHFASPHVAQDAVASPSCTSIQVSSRTSSIAENVFMGAMPRGRRLRLLDAKAMSERTAELLGGSVGLDG